MSSRGSLFFSGLGPGLYIGETRYRLTVINFEATLHRNIFRLSCRQRIWRRRVGSPAYASMHKENTPAFILTFACALAHVR